MGNVFFVSCIIASCFAPTNVTTFVLSQPKIEQAQVVTHGDEVFVAIITEPLFTRSEKVALVENIIVCLKEKFFYKNVIVSMDCDLFYKAKKINSQTNQNPLDIEKLFILAKER